MQCGNNDEHKSYLLIDYAYIPAKGFVYENKTLVKKWSVNKPVDLVKQVIDTLDITGFEKLRMKSSLDCILDIFEPKSIKIINKI